MLGVAATAARGAGSVAQGVGKTLSPVKVPIGEPVRAFHYHPKQIKESITERIASTA